MISIAQAKVSGKNVIVRCDFDVPIKNGLIEDPSRIDRSIPTIKYLLEKGARLILLSHLGRPTEIDQNLSLKAVKSYLEKTLKITLDFQSDLNRIPTAQVTLFENLRFWPQEEENDSGFASKLGSFGEIYVNECFASSHRKHASIFALATMLPSFAGLNLEKEIEELSKIIKSPNRPLIAIIGGAKIETKLPVIFNLAKIADKVLVGGKLMFEISRGSLPENVVVAHDDIDTKDIGKNSQQLFSSIITEASTVVWNGPMGMFEEIAYEIGTKSIARAVISSKAYSVVGGGDTISALNKFSLLDKINFVSTGGGAMLEFLSGKNLPGLEVLN